MKNFYDDCMIYLKHFMSKVGFKDTYLKLAESLPEISKGSNCLHRQVAAILFNKKLQEIKAVGTNVTPSEVSPCVSSNSCTKHITGKCPIIHAEVNCIHNYLKQGFTSFEDIVMICSYSPCFECSKVIVSMGIKEFYYVKKHHKTDFKYLENNNVKCIQLEEGKEG